LHLLLQFRLIIPLNDLLDKYGFYSKQLLEYVPDGRKQITAPDGNIYGMPALEECYHCTLSQKMWINKTWLDTLGLEMPETTDDFYNVLKAFKEQDPNGNGKADEIPLSGCLDWWHTNVDGFLMNAFIYNDGGNRLNLVDGKVIPAFTQDEWKEGLKYLNMLFVEGLLDPEAFVQGPEQLRQLVENDEAIMLGACPTGTPAAFALDTGEATKNYTCVPPLKGPSGAQNTGYYPSTLWAGAFITKNCKYPEVAFRWLDYLLSEEATIRQVFGEEGVDWRPAQDGEIGLDGNPGLIKEINVLPGMYEQNQGIEILCNINKKIFNGRVVDPNDEWYIEKRLADETKKYEGYEPDEVLPPLFMTVDDVKEYSELQAGINQYVTQSIARFITGDMDIETDWEKYLQELKNMGIDRYIEIVQKTYDSQYKN